MCITHYKENMKTFIISSIPPSPTCDQVWSFGLLPPSLLGDLEILEQPLMLRFPFSTSPVCWLIWTKVPANSLSFRWLILLKEHFWALKLTNLESFSTLRLSNLEIFRVLTHHLDVHSIKSPVKVTIQSKSCEILKTV